MNGGLVMRGGNGGWKRLLRRTVVVAGVGALGAWLVTVVVPAEAATWTSTYNVSATGWTGQDSPTVSVDRQGDALLVWAAGDPKSQYGYPQAQARIRTAAGSLGAIKTLSPVGTFASSPQVASDDDGDSAVVWQQDNQVVGRRISATGAVGTLRTLSTTTALNPSVAVDPSGRALVVWNEIRGPFYTVARYFNKDGSLGPVLVLDGGSGDKPAIGIDRLGAAVVAWSEGYQRVVAVRIKPGTVSTLKVIAPAATGLAYGRVSVGVDRDGDAIVSYRRAVNSTGLARMWARLWSRTGTLGTALGVSPSTENVTLYSALAMDLEGDSVVLWSRPTSTTQTDVLGRRISRTGGLGTITRLGVGDRPAVTLDDDGNGVAVWNSPGPPYEATKVYARTISTAGVFNAAQLLSSDGRVPQADSSPAGRFTVTWQQRSYTYQIRARTGQ